jgi:hypothetical protein
MMRTKLLVVFMVTMMVLGSSSPAVAQPYLDLGFVDDLIDKAVENVPSEESDECGWYWDEWYGWQYWCWSPSYGWYLSDGCVNRAWQQNNSTTGEANYSYQSSYQSCSASD